MPRPGRHRLRRYDLVILGGGTAGLVAALGAAGVGARVALVTREAPGGDCLWTGCVPSKSLIAAADLAHRMRHADAVGLERVRPRIDFARVMAHVHGARERIAPQDSADRLRHEGVTVVEGQGRFAGSGEIAVDGRTLPFRRALIATGSRPALPPVPGLDQVAPLTNETVWDLTELPGRLAILGGGPIGCELGQAFARLGSDVTLIELEDDLLGKEEPEARALIARRLRAEDVQLRLGARATRARMGSLTVQAHGVEANIDFDRVLVAAGRRPESDGLGLAAVGVKVDGRGAVVVDDRLRTSARGVFAAGDVTGALPFTHVAGYHGRTVVANALFGARGRVAYDAVPWVTFTDPEVARVGLAEADARARWGDRATVWRYDYARLDRAITAGRAEGFAKLVGDPRGHLVGATVAAPAGGEAIAELAAWIVQGRRIDDVSRTVHAYPTFAEGPARAADEHLRARYFSPRVRAVTRPALALARLLDPPR